MTKMCCFKIVTKYPHLSVNALRFGLIISSPVLCETATVRRSMRGVWAYQRVSVRMVIGRNRSTVVRAWLLTLTPALFSETTKVRGIKQGTHSNMLSIITF